MNVTHVAELPGVVLIEPCAFLDARGSFFESYQESRYLKHGIGPFVQDNCSRSTLGVLRGLHFQLAPADQGKLVSVVRGAIFDVAVDIRTGSNTFGRWYGKELNDENRYQLWIPPGFAHGFYTMSHYADVMYKCTKPYSTEHERSLLWNDPSIGIKWPIKVGESPILSHKDSKALTIGAHLSVP